MIPSLSDKYKKRSLKKKRIALISFSFILILSWTFLKPVLLVVFDPFTSLYSHTKSSMYSTYEKTKTFFTTKQKSLLYIKELEEENSYLQNKLAYYDHTNCEKGFIKAPKVVTSDATVQISSSTIPEPATILPEDPCLSSRKEVPLRATTLRASPLLSSFSYLYDTLRLNKGSFDHVQENDIVFTRGMVAIGKVSATAQTSSLVLLYSKDGIETYGSLLRNGETFKLIGNGGGTYVSQINRDIAVEVGDVILLTENQDYTIGTVKNISFLKQDVSKTIYIEGGFNPSQSSSFYLAAHE